MFGGSEMDIFRGKRKGFGAVCALSTAFFVLLIAVLGPAFAVSISNGGVLQADAYRSTAPETAPEYRPPIFVAPVREEYSSEEYLNAETKPKTVYAEPVLKAVRYMRITPEHLSMWADKRENTVLKALSELPADQQRRVACIAAYIRGCNGRLSAETIWREACAMYFYGRQYNIAPELVAAVAKAESTFNCSSVSRHGACGVMQVMYSVHKGALAKYAIVSSRDQIFDPERGVHAGVFVLKGYVNACGSVQKGLMRYLGGHSNKYYMRVQNNVTRMRQTGERLGL